MFKIDKKEPVFFTKAKKGIKLPKNSNAWSDEKIAKIRSDLRNYILNNEQHNLCAYCERKIESNSEKSNIDHFKTRNLFPQETVAYDNLLVSCNNKKTCSSHKDKNIKSKEEYEKIVNPITENPDDFFDYLPTGEIVAKNQKAKFTIEIFNLGTFEADNIVQSRKKLTQTIENINLPLDEILKCMNYEFQSFIINIYKKLQGVTQ